jgi:hypothetical protein
MQVRALSILDNYWQKENMVGINMIFCKVVSQSDVKLKNLTKLVKPILNTTENNTAEFV